jgi:hypothetical protein
MRFLLAYDPGLLAHGRRIFARTVLAFVRAQGKRQWRLDGRSGAVCFVQRFDSGLRVNADALTHVGQLNMLRRMAGSPVRGESYNLASIRVGQTGLEQPPAGREFD